MNNIDIPNFKIWVYDYDDSVLSYDYETKLYETSLLPPLPNQNSFFLPKHHQLKKKEIKKKKLTFEEYHKHLKKQMKEYSVVLIEDRKALVESTKLKIDFDYFDNSYKMKCADGTMKIYYRTHGNNVKTFFKRLCKNDKNEYKFKYFDDVYYDEYIWFKNCKNCGLMYLKEKGKYKDTYGYDFKMSYPTDMSDISFMMPTKRGKEKYITELPVAKYISFGIYRVSITCDDDNFNKIFTINDKDYYTSYSLKFALKMQKKLNIKIKLIIDSKPNAYIYERKDLISGNKLFGNWYNRLVDLKKEFPFNGLIKMLASSGWGHLQEAKIEYVDEPQLIEMLEEGKRISHHGNDLDYIIADIKMIGDRTRYSLINSKKAVYDLPFRLLPFITSFSRVKMGEVINKFDVYDDVLRIQTDSITFLKEFNEVVKGFMYDDKISGNIKFKHVNNYKKY